MRQHLCITFSCYAFIIYLFFQPAKADVSSTLLIRTASDSIYNGTSENTGQPIVAINAEFQVTSTLVAGVQFQDSEPENVRQRNRNLSTYLGYDKKISRNWLSSTYFTHRTFPGGQREWDYDEFSSRLSHRSGASIGVSYSPNYYSSSVKAIGTTIKYSRPLIERVYVKTEIGNVSIPSLFSYQFAEATVGTSYKRFNVELGYHWTSDTILHTPVGNITSPQFVLSVNYVAF
jgi:hypothetical protein